MLRRLVSLLLLLAAPLLADETPKPAPESWGEDVETPGKHYDRVTDSLAEEVNTLNGKVLVIWVVDGSASMKDDREAVRDRLRRFMDAVDARRVTLRMAVWGFGEEAVETQGPTTDVEKVMKGLPSAPLDESGRENCMAAALAATRRYSGLADQKFIVLLTDERGDDDRRVESLIQTFRNRHVRVSCIGREACFASRSVYEVAEGRLVPVDAGPEAPGPEVLGLAETCLSIGAGLETPQEIPSGFGCWAQERLCRQTGGHYYPFRSGALRGGRGPSYDRSLLDARYAPSWEARAEWEAWRDGAPLARACLEVMRVVVRLPVPSFFCQRNEEAPGWLRRTAETAHARRKSLNELSTALAKARQEAEGVELPERARAAAQLLQAQLRYMIWDAAELEDSVEALLKAPLPTLRGTQGLLLELPDGEGSRNAAPLRENARLALDQAAQDRAGTPWAAMARAYRLGGPWRLKVVNIGPTGPRPRTPGL